MQEEIKEGYKKTEIGVIPEDWEVKRLEEISELNPESLDNSTDENLLIHYIDIESVSTGKISNIKNVIFKDSPSRARRVVKKDDIIISTVRPYLKAFVKVKQDIENLVCSTGFIVIRCKEKSNSEYIFQYTLSEIFLNQLINKMVGTNYPAVNISDIKIALVPFPTINEQLKIASILSTVDEHIEQTDELIEKTKELKKGLMQKLLTKSIGHTEFKKTEIGEIPKDWEVKRISEVVELQIGGTPSRKIDKYWDKEKKGKNIWVSIKDLNSVKKYIYDSLEYISDLGIKHSNVKKIKKDTVIMSFKLTIGKTAITRVDLYTNEAIVAFNINDNKILNYNYLFYILPNLQYDFDIAVKGVTLNKQKIYNTYIPLPPLSEQQKIASILSEVDNKIEQYELRKEKLQNLKKGLMQKLLTGKIRVKVNKENTKV